MKKFLAILAVLAAICMTSCTIDTSIYSEDYNVLPGDWKIMNGNDALSTYLYVTLPNDDITGGVINNGIVSASIYIPTENTWTPLPYTIPYEYAVKDDKGNPTGEIGIVTEVFRFEYAAHEITFIIQDMDGATPVFPEEQFHFRVNTMR